MATQTTSLEKSAMPNNTKWVATVLVFVSTACVAAAARQLTVNGLRREAVARLDNGDYDRAVAALRKVLELSPAAASSELELGVALLKTGQTAEAADHLQAAARLEDSLEVHEQLASAYAALGRQADSERELARSQQLRRQMLLGEGRR
jgi:tetratricopeptide (TPR) repeat protein